ncbi:MAG: electron transport complex subunit RsxC [Bacteroidales bacterium]|nr:electron transport complex subunit RsxC [Bacteroidales bacterium]
MNGLKTFPLGGVHPDDCKFTAQKPIEQLPIPERVYIPLSQSLGASSVPIVNKGDKVKTGQLIAKGEAFISSNIHSSVTGEVEKIDEWIDTSGYRRKTVIIKTTEDVWEEGIDLSKEIKREITLTKEEIIQRIKDKGIVGLGGATFPTHVKVSIPQGKKAEFLIINGVECEPYLTSDHRLMLEKAEEILIGTQILMKAIDVDKAIIGIEANKPDAIEHLSKIAQNYKGIQVQALKLKYPQGAEKQLIKALVNREVPSGKLPIEVGCVVQNVGTAFAVYEAVQKNKPLIERVVTLTGNSWHGGNFWVRIGTTVQFLIDHCGGLPTNIEKIINGGPMMGKALVSTDVPITKGTSGILAFTSDISRRVKIYNCIRCGKCVSACPMGLEPVTLEKAAENANWDIAEKYFVLDCIECGSCHYTCPAGRPLLDMIRLAKNKVNQIVRSRVQ